MIDLAGKKFGHWTVIRLSHKAWRGSSGNCQLRWLCRCVCGRMLSVLGSGLRNGTSKSCGCKRSESRRLASTASGRMRDGKPSTEFYIWQTMLQRCHNPRYRWFKNYGGRGITVCARWRKSFDAFFADMGPRPAGMSLDRVNNMKGYSPANCRWATGREQCNNKTNNRILEFRGLRLTLTQMAEHHGLTRHQLWQRLHEDWPLEQALTTPVASKYWRRFALNGEIVRPSEIARRVGMSPRRLAQRLQNGWPLELALKAPKFTKLSKMRESLHQEQAGPTHATTSSGSSATTDPASQSVPKRAGLA